MREIYLANAFSLNMIDTFYIDSISITKYDYIEDFIEDIKDDMDYLGKKEINCVIGHKSTAELAKKLLEEKLGIELKCERKQIKLHDSDILYVIQLSFRAPEGKIYSLEELEELFKEGKIAFYRLVFF